MLLSLRKILKHNNKRECTNELWYLFFAEYFLILNCLLFSAFKPPSGVSHIVTLSDFLTTEIHAVTCIPIARQRLGKHIPSQANARNSRTSIAMQWFSKHTSLITEAVFSAWSVQGGYKEVFGRIDQ
jgi:hypothetical protein